MTSFLMRLSGKLNRLRGLQKQLYKPARKVGSTAVAALFLCNTVFGNIVFAETPLVPTSDQWLYEQQTITVEQSVETDAAPTTAEPAKVETQESVDAFLYDGPLSAATETEEMTTSSLSATATKAYYVSTNGSTSGDGSQQNPWGSIQQAINQIQPGETLYIMEGTYTQSVDLKSSGTSDAYITIEGIGNVIIDGGPLNDYEPIFDTKGFDYIRFKNLEVHNSRDAVEVSPGSNFIEIDGLKTNNNHFAVKINSASDVIVRNVVALNSRNAFRTENNGGSVPSRILFENIEARGSQDRYTGYESKYFNGDGFILEAGNNITIRNVISADNWDGGFDIKANNVLVENVITYGNKNNFKIWGNAIVVKNALVYNARYMPNDPVAGEGNGVNARTGSVKFINSTFVDNDRFDIKVDNDGGPSNVTFENSIIARKKSDGQVFTNVGGSFTDKNNLWYWQGHSNPGFNINSSSFWGDPQFVNWDGKDFHLQSLSMAIDNGTTSSAISLVDFDNNDRISGATVDIGAYEYQLGGPDPTDIIPPVISSVTSADIASTSAAIKWTTNELSDSVVEYRKKGTTSWLSSAPNSALVTSHSVVLSNLTAETEYEFRVKSKDAAGNSATQLIISSFVTLAAPTQNPDTNPFQEVSGSVAMEAENYFGSTTVNNKTWEITESSGDVSGSKAILAGPDTGSVVSNTADSPRVDFKVKFDTAGTYYVWVRGYAKDGGSDSLHVGLDGQLATGGDRLSGFTFDGSQPSWAYQNMDKVRVSFNIATPGEHTLNLWMREDGFMADKIVLTQDANFVPQGQGPVESKRAANTSDTTAPVINAVASGELSETSAKISWTTDEASDSQVEYRKKGDATWLITPLDSALVTTHAVQLSALEASTEYEFRVKSKDAAGNLATQATISSFSTVDLTAPVISGVTASDVTDVGAMIRWTTDEAGDSKVEYRKKGTTAWLSSLVDSALLKEHSVVLSELAAETEYEYRVLSQDGAGNSAVSSILSTFVTLKTPTQNPETKPFQEVSGSVVMEAENLFDALTVNGKSWNIMDAPGDISGSKALSAGPDTGSVVSNTADSPRADFKVKFDTTGTYYAWVRGYAKDGGSDSLHIGLNGQVVTGGDRLSGFTFDGSQPSWAYQNMDKVRVSFNIATPGEHTLNLWMREDGFMADKIVLTQDANFVPQGQGPVESERAGEVSDTTAPVISAVASSDVTQTSAKISWTTNEAGDSQVEYRKKSDTAWLSTPVDSSLMTNHAFTLNGLAAGTDYEFRVKSKDAAGNAATQATISSFKTLAQQNTNSDMVGVTNGAIVTGVVQIGPNLQKYPGTQKVSYYLNGTKQARQYSSPFTWGGSAGFDTRTLKDGTYTLSGEIMGSGFNTPFTVTFTVQNSTVVPPADTTAPVISSVLSSDITETGLKISWSTNEASDSQVEYRKKGDTTWSSSPINSSLVTNHSISLSGLTAGTDYEFRVKSKDQAGNLATQASVSSFKTLAQQNSDMIGVSHGSTVSGVIQLGPNLQKYPATQKVSFYLNGTKQARQYSAPFYWGGSGGFDTRTLSNGTYTLTGEIMGNGFSVPYAVTFTVNN